MLDNNTTMLILGITMLFTAINGFLFLRLSRKIAEQKKSCDKEFLQGQLDLSSKTIEIYENMEKTMVEANKSHTEQLNRLIDVIVGQLNSLDQRIDDVSKRLVTKKSNTRGSKAPKEEMLKS